MFGLPQHNKTWTPKKLKDFEAIVAEHFKQGHIKCPIHLCGGNELQLIEIFQGIFSRDYVFSTHRNSYHYLLHTNDAEGLLAKILAGDSMHTCSPEHNFYSSSIVAGCVAIAAGVALALKMKESPAHVYCFIGDGATDEGWFQEAFKYASTMDLPIKYIIENNDRSVCTSTEQRWGRKMNFMLNDKVIVYDYKCEWPHCGMGKWVTF